MGGGSGIGWCMVYELVLFGVVVVLVGCNVEKFVVVCMEIVEVGGIVYVYVCNICDEVVV